jgi:lysophospholipase L1-like esterase
MTDSDSTSPPPAAEAPERKGCLVNVALVLGSLIVFFAVFEGGARVYTYFRPDWAWIHKGWPNHDQYGWWRYDAHLWWRLPRSDAEMETNAQGLRNPDFPIEKPAGVKRVINVGDSSAFGVFVPRTEAYAGKLETLLNEADDTAEWQVINAGVPGYTSQQALRYLDNLRPLQPDAIIAYVGRNSGVRDSIVHDTEKPYIEHPIGNWAFDAFRGSRFCVVTANVCIRIRVKLFGERQLPPDNQLVQRVPPEAVHEHLASMQSIAEAEGAKLFVMPYLLDIRKEVFEPRAHIDYAVEGATVVDFKDRWEAYLTEQDADLSDLMTDPIHPNTEGHRMIAEALLEAFEAQGLVGTP